MDWKKLIFLPLWLLILLTLISTAGLVAVFAKGWETTPVADVVYALAFYTLCTVTVFLVMVLPKQYGKIRQKILDHPIGNRYVTDPVFRTKVSLYLSLGINLAYVVINLLSWYYVRSWWFAVLAIYYVILSAMRFLLVGYVRKNDVGSSLLREWKRSRTCTCILLLLNLSLSGAVLMILYQSKGYEYAGIMIYIMAIYTFYSTVHAIVDMVKYRSLGSPVMSTAKLVSLCAALVSMLNLETAMFAEFGADMSVADQRLFIILTGAGVSATVVTLSVLGIVTATKEIRRLKDGE